MLLEAAGAEEEGVSGAAAVGGSGAAAEEAPPREQEEKQESEKEEQEEKVEDQDPEQPARVVEMDEGGMGIEPEEEAAEGAEEAMEAAAGGGEEHAEENAEEKYVEENHQDEMKAEQSASHEIVEEAEGWRLHLSSSSNTGYKGVSRKPDGRFLARGPSLLPVGRHIGIYDTAVQAAVAYARQFARLQDGRSASNAALNTALPSNDRMPGRPIERTTDEGQSDCSFVGKSEKEVAALVSERGAEAARRLRKLDVVRVWWPRQRTWFQGHVTDFRLAIGKHHSLRPRVPRSLRRR